MGKKRLRDYGIIIGRMPPGVRNTVTDVPGVTVGHVTVRNETHRTGVTVVVPGPGNAFTEKYTAACYVHNGFGKSTGLVQIDELGTLETPVALTNTLNVGLVWDGIAQDTIDRCRAEGVAVSSLNPVVGECNDSLLNEITARAVRQQDVLEAIDGAGADFEEGDVGAGCGTVCFGLKGGIGSSSRVVGIGGRAYVVGVLVQSNFGAMADLLIGGVPAGGRILERIKKEGDEPAAQPDRGSIMTVVATDLPVSSRQLRRILRRAGVGIARTGAYTGHGSGEVMIGFTTANRVPEDAGEFLTFTALREDLLDPVFQAVAEATNEAILDSMVCAERAAGRKGGICRSLAEFLPECMYDSMGWHGGGPA